MIFRQPAGIEWQAVFVGRVLGVDMLLVKYLQSQGIGSRKQCQQLLDAGCVSLNGQVVYSNEMWAVDTIHSLSINGQNVVVIPQPYFYILLNKPMNYETSHRPQCYPSIFALLPDNLRQVPMQAVGRLDVDTTGVLLITNDGQFNHRMTSPKHKVAKQYRVGLKHVASDTLCQQLLQGVLLKDDDEIVCADAAELLDNTTLLLTISQGKYHQVKRMIAAAGNRVESLHRERFGDWSCEHLASGQWQFFNPMLPE